MARGGYWVWRPEVVQALRTDGSTGAFHLRPAPGRRAFCGYRARDLTLVAGSAEWPELTADDRCPRCSDTYLALDREYQARQLAETEERLTLVEGVFRAFPMMGAIAEMVQSSQDGEAAVAALTGPPFGFSSAQAEHVLYLALREQTLDARDKLDAERSYLLERISELREHP